MNKVYKIVWSTAKGCFQVCSEFGKSASKTSSTKVKSDITPSTLSKVFTYTQCSVFSLSVLGSIFTVLPSTTYAAACSTVIDSATSTACDVSTGNSLTITSNGSITVTSATRSTPVAVTNTSAASIVNNGSISTTDGMAIRVQTSGSVTDGIVNNGVIESAGHAIELYDNASVSAGTAANGAAIYNSGTIISTESSEGDTWGDESALRIQGSSVVNGDILNDGSMSGYIAGIYITDSVINGSIINNGLIQSLDYGLYNSGSILGSIDNYGTITGSNYSLYNSGTVDSAINNYGVLNGNVYLGAATLNLLASATATTTEPEVHGDITGDISGDSVINIGSTTDSTTFTTDGNADVGGINVASGSTLALSNGNNWNASADFTNNGTITLADTTTTSDVSVGAGSTFTNSGTIDLSSNALAGDTLTINGNYVGNNGNLLLDTVLGDDASLTDKLVITGDASGTTYVTVTNLGSSGSQTVEGLEVVEVDGTSTSNAFVQNGRIVAGAYEYSLVKGNASGSDTESWYLSSLNSSGTQTLRAEAGSYLANLAAANTMFDMSLHDRFPIDKTNSHADQAVWIKGTTDRTKFKDTTGQISTETDKSTVQIGVDLAQWDNGQDHHFAAGLMTGYGKATSDSRSSVTGYKSTGTVDGYNVGAYATWYGSNAQGSDFYLDGWALWNDFNAQVNGQSVAEEKYNLSGMSTSLETGYAIKLGQSATSSYFIQPEAQLIWSDVDADHHTETNGTQVTGNSNNLQSRLGLRAYMKNISSNQITVWQPFVELNWLHNTDPYTISMDDGKAEQGGSKNIGEIKLGLEGQIKQNASLWINGASQQGSADYRNYGFKVGFKYNF